MIIEDLLNNSNRISLSEYKVFIFNLLKKIQDKNNKPLKIDGLEAFAEKGIDDIPNTTCIRVTRTIDKKRNLDVFFRSFQKRVSNLSKEEITNSLFIPMDNFPESSLTTFKEKAATYFPHSKIIVWNTQKISNIIKKYNKEANEIANQLFTLQIKEALERDDSNWKTKQKEKIEDLKEIYKKGTLSLLLGAGVSSSAGMPDWNTLLNSLFFSLLSKKFNKSNQTSNSDIEQIVKRFSEINGQSALILARYLKNGLNNKSKEAEKFTNEIATNLYKLRDKTKDESSELIKAIVNMCIPLRTGAKVKSVITYNFDNLLEKELNKFHIHNHSIYSDDVNLDPDELPIYHVHGFLPEDTSNYKDLDKSTLVFSEDGYHKIYSDAYHWSNLIQLTSLKENNCLLIGLSMNDPNLRRLLEIATRNSDKIRHYVFMKRISKDEFIYKRKEKDKIKVISNESGASLFLENHHLINEDIMRELGLSVIWYTDYDEIPKILNEITAVH